mgnify:CR=1 FL=1|jgi:hypothetical protein
MSQLAAMLKEAALPKHDPKAAQTVGKFLSQRWQRARYPLIALLSVFGASRLGKYLGNNALNYNFPERAREMAASGSA